MSFEKEGFCVLRKLLTPQTLKLAQTEFEMLRDVIYLTTNQDLNEHRGDNQVPESFAHYGSFVFEAMLESIRPDIEKATGKRLYPTYSYARIYYPGAVLEKHSDRYSCEYSVTACIAAEGDRWDIFFENKKGRAVRIDLEPGDVAIYKGIERPHWREAYTGEKQIQAFLHYVDADGPYSLFKYDTRPMLGMNPSTKRPL